MSLNVLNEIIFCDKALKFIKSKKRKFKDRKLKNVESESKLIYTKLFA